MGRIQPPINISKERLDNCEGGEFFQSEFDDYNTDGNDDNNSCDDDCKVTRV